LRGSSETASKTRRALPAGPPRRLVACSYRLRTHRHFWFFGPKPEGASLDFWGGNIGIRGAANIVDG